MNAVHLCVCCAGLFLVFQDAPQPGTSVDSAGAAASQPSRPRMSGHPPSLYLLIPDEVQSELGLSEEQRSESRALLDSYLRDTRDDFRALRAKPTRKAEDVGSVEGDAREETVARLNTHSRDYEKRALALLSEPQRVRLGQLKLRAQRVWIFFDASVRAKLRIEDAQMRSIVEGINKAETLCREALRDAKRRRADRGQVAARVEKLRDDAWTSCLGQLSAQQRAILDEIRGPEPDFDLHKLRFGVGIGRRNGQ